MTVHMLISETKIVVVLKWVPYILENKLDFIILINIKPLTKLIN